METITNQYFTIISKDGIDHRLSPVELKRKLDNLAEESVFAYEIQAGFSLPALPSSLSLIHSIRPSRLNRLSLIIQLGFHTPAFIREEIIEWMRSPLDIGVALKIIFGTSAPIGRSAQGEYLGLLSPTSRGNVNFLLYKIPRLLSRGVLFLWKKRL